MSSAQTNDKDTDSRITQGERQQQATPTVKICGLMDDETVRGVVALHVDYIGFVFARSRRQIQPGQAGRFIRIVQALPEQDRPQTVGVFVTPTREELVAVMAEAPLDVIQLHHTDEVALCQFIKQELKAAVHLVIAVDEDGIGELEQDSTPGTSQTALTATGDEEAKAMEKAAEKLAAAMARLAPYQGVVDAVLLDTYDPVYGGGSGRTFPWEAIPDYREAAHRLGMKLIAAGGLNGENVGRLMADYGPDGVDVSSGVETDGHKDMVKINRFVERVRAYATNA